MTPKCGREMKKSNVCTVFSLFQPGIVSTCSVTERISFINSFAAVFQEGRFTSGAHPQLPYIPQIKLATVDSTRLERDWRHGWQQMHAWSFREATFSPAASRPS